MYKKSSNHYESEKDEFCEDKEKYHSELTLDEIFPRKEKKELSLKPKKSPKLVVPDRAPPTTTTPTSLSTTPEVTTTTMVTTMMVTDASTTLGSIELTVTSQLTHPASKKNRKWSKKSTRNEKKSKRKSGRGKRSLGQMEEILTIDFGEISPGHNYTLFLN